MVCRRRHTTRELGHDSTRVHGGARTSLLAIFGVDEFGEANESEFATLVCGSSRHEDMSSDRGDIQDSLQSVVLPEEKRNGCADNQVGAESVDLPSSPPLIWVGVGNVVLQSHQYRDPWPASIHFTYPFIEVSSIVDHNVETSKVPFDLRSSVAKHSACP